MKVKTAPLLALLLLCLLWACASLRSDLLPGSISTANSSSLMTEAILLGLFAAIAAIAALAYKASWPRGRTLGAMVVAGLGLFAVPSVLIQIASGGMDESTRVALFSLAPVFALVFEPYLGSVSSSRQRGALMASLLAVAGTLLVFPLDLPRSTGAVAAFCGAIAAVALLAAANCTAVRMASEQPAPSTLSFATVAAGSAAIALVLLGSVFEHHARNPSLPDPWIALDLLALALLFWLMRRMTAVRMTTRFLLAPLLANLIGLAFLRPEVQPRGWLGLSLIAAGAGWLVFGPEDEPEETGSPLRINEP
jgi:drug/metabolite transporter (DMT)-like permease